MTTDQTVTARAALRLAAALAAVSALAGPLHAQDSPAAARALLDRYCITCHNARIAGQGAVPVAFDDLDPADIGRHPETWEQVVRKLRLGMMPPVGRPRPDQAAYDTFVPWLEAELDRLPSVDPGRPAVRRLTEAEYINAIDSLLAVEIDRRWLLFPADDVDEAGFATNGDVLSISPALFERYLAAANRISRLAVGDPTIGPGYAAATYDTHRLLYQDDRASEDLPFGTRGGLAIRHYFPVDGEYELTIRLRRMIYDYIVGMRESQQLDVRLDGELLESFTVGDAEQHGYPSAYTFFGTIRGDPAWEEFVSKGADAHLNLRFEAPAGVHVVGIAFANARTEATGVLERRLSGFSLSGRGFYHDNAAVARVNIVGPHRVSGPGDTPSRRQIFTCRPAAAAAETACARQILSSLARRAYRRPATTVDVDTLMEFYVQGRSERGFEGGIQKAVERLLVSPEFLFRIEADPVDAVAGTAYRLTDLELATRLSLFIWSDIPDEELLALAEGGQLREPAETRGSGSSHAGRRAVACVGRQLPGPLVAAQSPAGRDAGCRRLLRVRRESACRHDPRDDAVSRQPAPRGSQSARSADRRLHVRHERLAGHYGIPDVHGERFRRVVLEDPRRGGVLGHASLLTVTSYPTRTSPVLRGKWLLDNILGMPPAPPPADVPALAENDGRGAVLSLRERTERHRRNPACAVCHRVMDPPGFALEHFDAVGRWRAADASDLPVDAAGVLGDGTPVDGPAALRAALGVHRESYVRTVTGKLLTYALGRRIEYFDQPAIRANHGGVRREDHRWSAIIREIVKSMPFQMREPSHDDYEEGDPAPHPPQGDGHGNGPAAARWHGARVERAEHDGGQTGAAVRRGVCAHGIVMQNWTPAGRGPRSS